MNLETRRLRIRSRNRWQMSEGEWKDKLVEKSGRKKYITERIGRSS
jgi:hypothetical protein